MIVEPHRRTQIGPFGCIGTFRDCTYLPEDVQRDLCNSLEGAVRCCSNARLVLQRSATQSGREIRAATMSEEN